MKYQKKSKKTNKRRKKRNKSNKKKNRRSRINQKGGMNQKEREKLRRLRLIKHDPGYLRKQHYTKKLQRSFRKKRTGYNPYQDLSKSFDNLPQNSPLLNLEDLGTMDKIQQEVKKLQLSSIATTERMVMDFKIFTRDNYPSTDSIDLQKIKIGPLLKQYAFTHWHNREFGHTHAPKLFTDNWKEALAKGEKMSFNYNDIAIQSVMDIFGYTNEISRKFLDTIIEIELVYDYIYGEINTLESFIFNIIIETVNRGLSLPGPQHYDDLFIDEFINVFRSKLDNLSIVKREETLQLFLDKLLP